MAYVVYVNHPNNKAIIHTDSCRIYDRRKRQETHNGYWEGPFKDLEEAENFARSTKKRILDYCAFCMKNLT